MCAASCSGQVAQILGYIGVPYKGVNVLEDQEIREGIKAYSNWPTIPQLYVRANSSAAATSPARCSRPVNCSSSSRREGHCGEAGSSKTR